jgi:hypothetical protein
VFDFIAFRGAGRIVVDVEDQVGSSASFCSCDFHSLTRAPFEPPQSTYDHLLSWGIPGPRVNQTQLPVIHDSIIVRSFLRIARLHF